MQLGLTYGDVLGVEFHYQKRLAAMSEQMPLFEVVSEEEFTRTAPRTKGYTTEPRTLTVWYTLPHSFGFCTVPRHEEVQEKLEPDQKEYRQRYPTRLTFPIGEYMVCRDCFIVEADKDG